MPNKCDKDKCWAWRREGNICVVMPSKPVGEGECTSYFDRGDILPRPKCNLQVGDRAIIMLPGIHFKQTGTVVRKQLMELNDRAYQIYYIRTEDGYIQDYFGDEIDRA